MLLLEDERLRCLRSSRTVKSRDSLCASITFPIDFFPGISSWARTSTRLSNVCIRVAIASSSSCAWVGDDILICIMMRTSDAVLVNVLPQHGAETGRQPERQRETETQAETETDRQTDPDDRSPTGNCVSPCFRKEVVAFHTCRWCLASQEQEVSDQLCLDECLNH